MENQTVAQKLDALVKLQSIDTQLDQLRKLRGDLPDEVQDLEDEIEGYKTRKDKFSEQLSDLEGSIKTSKEGMKTAESLITKYKDQQMNVRNNREYDAITKEIELQELEIQICEKKIREAGVSIENKQKEIDEISLKIEDRTKDLEIKKSELDDLLADSRDDEDKLLKDREKAVKKIEPKLLKYYDKLRANLSNGLAVVTVKRGAAEGCNIVIPPQKIAEIRSKKKIVIDEHSGRILADVDMESMEEEKKPRRTTRRKTTK